MTNPKVIYITGDRSLEPLASVSLVTIVLHKISHELNQPDSPGVRFTTGNSPTGIERAVRYMLPERVLDVVAYDKDDEGKLQFETMHEIIAPIVNEVWFLHPDPLSSRIGKSVHKHFAPDIIKMPLQEL